MGSSKSKVRKLNPKTMTELQRNMDVDFTRDEIEEWFREYQATLGKGMSKLTMKEFREVYNSVFDGDAVEFVTHLFRSFDIDNDGFVDFKEFIVGLCVSGSEKPETKLKWAFKMYDIDGNGSISRGEMQSMLKAIYRMISTDMSNTRDDLSIIDELVVEFFRSADRDHDDAISEKEFIDGVTDMPVILHLLQCDPNAGDLDDDGTVKTFDTLAIDDEARKPETVTDGGDSNKDTGESRKAVYTAK